MYLELDTSVLVQEKRRITNIHQKFQRITPRMFYWDKPFQLQPV